MPHPVSVLRMRLWYMMPQNLVYVQPLKYLFHPNHDNFIFYNKYLYSPSPLWITHFYGVNVRICNGSNQRSSIPYFGVFSCNEGIGELLQSVIVRLMIMCSGSCCQGTSAIHEWLTIIKLNNRCGRRKVAWINLAAIVGKMEFSEMEGDRSGSKIYATCDGHLYRRNKASWLPDGKIWSLPFLASTLAQSKERKGSNFAM